MHCTACLWAPSIGVVGRLEVLGLAVEAECSNRDLLGSELEVGGDDRGRRPGKHVLQWCLGGLLLHHVHLLLLVLWLGYHWCGGRRWRRGARVLRLSSSFS